MYSLTSYDSTFSCTHPLPPSKMSEAITYRWLSTCCSLCLRCCSITYLPREIIFISVGYLMVAMSLLIVMFVFLKALVYWSYNWKICFHYLIYSWKKLSQGWLWLLSFSRRKTEAWRAISNCVKSTSMRWSGLKFSQGLPNLEAWVLCCHARQRAVI